MSNKIKHTPAPWQHYLPNELCKTHTIRANDGQTTIVKLNSKNGYDEIIANAQLIAAAPELLEALKLCVTQLADAELFPEREDELIALKIAQAAIVKAEGK